jgi:hypothetical protein
LILWKVHNMAEDPDVPSNKKAFVPLGENPPN